MLDFSILYSMNGRLDENEFLIKSLDNFCLLNLIKFRGFSVNLHFASCFSALDAFRNELVTAVYTIPTIQA